MSLVHRLTMALVALIMVAPVLAIADEPETPNFRNVRWYDHMDVVKERELAKFLEYRDHEINVAVRPPKPWKTEHLYYEDTLLDKRVRVLYRFDNDCELLYRADYIFDMVLSDGDTYALINAVEDKYGVELNTSTINGDIYSSGRLDEETTINFNQSGLLHHHTNNTVIYYQTSNFHWMIGWGEGAEPNCVEKVEALNELQEKL